LVWCLCDKYAKTCLCERRSSPCHAIFRAALQTHATGPVANIQLYHGGQPDIDYQSKVQDISRPARLYVFSDGVYDITKPDGSIWGLSEFLAFSTQSFHIDRPNLDCLLKHTRTIAPKEVFEDDLTILEIVLSESQDFRFLNGLSVK
jgi:hypothetical protein